MSNPTGPSQRIAVPLTVDAIAAGTFAMMDMTALRLSIMKIYRTTNDRISLNNAREAGRMIRHVPSPANLPGTYAYRPISPSAATPPPRQTDTHAMMKKMRPSPKISCTMRLWSSRRTGNASFHAVSTSTMKSNAIE